ncbi:uncharacterized protein MONBRDRAFT_28084 [Monosiga brevicollis MX1]|uniref:Uncharacterized protein n=1 Tax=Monosiga brevicollis TaxID=81824 RepID=A9V755_MONBE|nr:uncharacterized protein MONBRDRAFT_28084 [Monosiga brevicollis MX1]EDQ86731.1 predicted protein [Monosiga brevicollis MX1]|eukprot:XP_001748567.1 hypothetical protein [Monosiga brevicollis MX1]
MKGAPEIMLSKCSTYLFRGQTRQIDEDFKDAFMSAYNRFGASGRRVLGFAYKHFQASDDVKFNEEANNFPTSDLHFVGLSAIMDPPKEGVRDAIEACHTASVKVFMVTGDHPLTAEAIAIQGGSCLVSILVDTRIVGILPKRAAKRESDSSEGVSPAQDSINPNRLRVIKGPDVSKLTAEDWRLILSRDMGTVFARTTPQDKLYIVRKCKEFGQVVAVTG